MATARVQSRTAQKSTFHFRWWMAVMLILLVVIIGLVFIRLSHAAVQPKLLYTSDLLGSAPGPGIFEVTDFPLQPNANFKLQDGQMSALDQTADSNKIAYTKQYDPKIYIKQKLTNGTYQDLVINNNAGETFYSPIYSPDGSKLAFIRYTTASSNTSELWVAEGDAKRKINVANNCQYKEFSWTPDSAEVVAACTTSSMPANTATSTNNIKRIKVSSPTTETTMLAGLPATTALPLAVSPIQFKSGFVVSYYSYSDLGVYQIGSSNPDKKLLFAAPAGNPIDRFAYSPDLLYMVYTKDNGANKEIWVYSFAKKTSSKLATANTNALPRVQWSRDGQKLVYISTQSTAGGVADIMTIARDSNSTTGFAQPVKVTSASTINHLRW